MHKYLCPLQRNSDQQTAPMESHTLQQVEKTIWATFDKLRGELSHEDYSVVLYLLVLRRSHSVLFEHHDSGWFSPSSFVDKAKDQIGYDPLQRDLVEEFGPIICKLQRESWNRIIEVFQSLDAGWLKENLGFLFERILKRVSKVQGPFAAQSWLPSELSEFIWGILDGQEIRRIYNPFSGYCTFGLGKKTDQEFVGQELNRRVWAIGCLRLDAHNKLENTHLLIGDSLNNWQNDQYRYDLVVTAPPIGLKIKDPIYSGFFPDIRNAEVFAVCKGLESLSMDGKLIAVVPQSFLFDGGVGKSFRNFLVENSFLESVILFPGGFLASSGISIAVVVLSKQKAKPELFRFIDAAPFCTAGADRQKTLDSDKLTQLYRSGKQTDSQTFVSAALIREQDYNLVVSRYFLRTYFESNLGDLGRIISTSKQKPGTIMGKFIRIRDLKDDKLVYQLDLESVPETDISVPSQKITQDCILLATRWNTLKPTLFEYKGEPVYISGDIAAYVPNGKRIIPEFLIHELHQSYVLEQLEALRLGSVQPYLRREDLLKIQIPVPSLKEQKAKIQEFLKTAVVERQVSTAQEIAASSLAAAEQNNFLRHSIAGLATNVKGSIDAILNIVNEQIRPNHPELLELKVSPISRLTFWKYLEILERDIKQISDAVTRDLRVEDEIIYKELEIIEIVDYLKSFVDEIVEGKQYDCQIEFSYDKDIFMDEFGNPISTFVEANRELLNKLLHNLIENAVAHAFTPKGVNRIEIYLMGIESEGKRDGVQILFSNTGKPFPEGYSFESFTRKGSSTGTNAGTGFGGWFINQIIKKLGGKLNFIDETGPEGLGDTDLVTSFEIDLPVIEISGIIYE